MLGSVLEGFRCLFLKRFRLGCFGLGFFLGHTYMGVQGRCVCGVVLWGIRFDCFRLLVFCCIVDSCLTSSFAGEGLFGMCWAYIVWWFVWEVACRQHRG